MHVFISFSTGSIHSHSYLLALTVRWKRPNKAQLPFPLQNQTRGLTRGGRLNVYILGSVTVSLLGKRVCAHILKLRIVRRDHPGLSRWALNPIRSVLMRDRRGDNTDGRGKGHIQMETDTGLGSCSRGTPGALRSSHRGEQGRSPRGFRGSTDPPTPRFWTFALPGSANGKELACQEET